MENFLPHKLNRSSNDGPNNSNTKALYRPPQVPRWNTRGIPSIQDTANQKKSLSLISRLQTLFIIINKQLNQQQDPRTVVEDQR